MDEAKAGWRGFLPALALALIVAATYAPCLRYEFVNWDDLKFILQNPFLAWPAHLFQGGVRLVALRLWSPVPLLANLSYAADMRLWGLNPAGFHATNVSWHVANTVLAFLLARRLARSYGLADDDSPFGGIATLAAAIAAGLFALHPLRVESVAWISDRKDLLCCFFFLGSLNAFIAYALGSPRKRGTYLLSLLLFGLALLSKPMAITLPLVLLILDYCPLRRLFGQDGGLKRSVLNEKIPFLVLSLAMGLLMIWNYDLGLEGNAAKNVPIAYSIGIASRVPVFYLWKLVSPLRLAPFYAPPADAFGGVFFISLLATLAISIFCLRRAKRESASLATWLYFLVTLGPIIDIVRHAEFFAADHYTLLPSLGPCLLAGGVFARFVQGLGSSRRMATLGLAGAALLILTALTLRDEKVWRDSGTLWTHQIEVYPNSELAHNNLGEYYYRTGRMEESLREFKTAMTLNPSDPAASRNAARVQYILLNSDAVGRGSLRIDPARNGALGFSFVKEGRYREAILQFSQAALIDPSVETYNNLGLALKHGGRKEEAEKVFLAALGLDPSSRVTHRNLGVLYAELGRKEDAAKEFSAARP